jgi:hypothetical protein
MHFRLVCQHPLASSIGVEFAAERFYEAQRIQHEVFGSLFVPARHFAFLV